MNILLIGGSGIISGEITNRSIEQGYTVTILNRGKRPVNPAAKTIIADVRKDSIDVLSNKIDNCYDVVVDFISYNPSQLKKSLEVFGTKCTQYIFVSSATAYKTTNGIISEKTPLKNDVWDYAQNKIECEDYLQKNYRTYCEHYTIIRPYITYDKTRVPYQFAPAEYYTIINRCQLGKPLPIYGGEVKCTLTSAKDFAVATTGLFLNDRAYEEDFHITSNYVATWRHIGEVIAQSAGVTATFVDIPEVLMRKSNGALGFSRDEIVGDKGRSMVFDNSKIQGAVPQFEGNIGFEEGVQDIFEYYKGGKRKINFAWDARIDAFISRASKITGVLVDKEKLSLKSYDNVALTSRDKIIYTIHRYDIPYTIFRILKKLLRRNI